jgi:hypothetical protein
MSIKTVHIIVIGASILLAFGCSGWALRDYLQHPAAGALAGGSLAMVTGVLLLWYLVKIIRKFRRITHYENQ